MPPIDRLVTDHNQTDRTNNGTGEPVGSVAAKTSTSCLGEVVLVLQHFEEHSDGGEVTSRVGFPDGVVGCRVLMLPSYSGRQGFLQAFVSLRLASSATNSRQFCRVHFERVFEAAIERGERCSRGRLFASRITPCQCQHMEGWTTGIELQYERLQQSPSPLCPFVIKVSSTIRTILEALRCVSYPTQLLSWRG